MDRFYLLRYRCVHEMIISGKEKSGMINTNFFDLLYTHLEERPVNNVFENLKLDEYYQESLRAECESYQQYEDLHLSKEQDKIVELLTEAITARNAAYSAVVFRMGMQCCFSLLLQLADLKCQKSDAIYNETESGIRFTVFNYLIF